MSISPGLAKVGGLHMSITVLDSAMLAGVGAVMSYVTARWRLKVLPDPGSGLRK